jgi:hypothetical protein
MAIRTPRVGIDDVPGGLAGEAMFIKIGSRVLNTDHIQAVNLDDGGRVSVRLSASAGDRLEDDRYFEGREAEALRSFFGEATSRRAVYRTAEALDLMG